MQYPIQVTMPQPGVSVPVPPPQGNRVGYYGNRSNNMFVQQQQEAPQEIPAIFNDD